MHSFPTVYTIPRIKRPLLSLVSLELGRRRQHSADSGRDLDAHEELFRSERDQMWTIFSVYSLSLLLKIDGECTHRQEQERKIAREQHPSLLDRQRFLPTSLPRSSKHHREDREQSRSCTSSIDDKKRPD